MTDEKQPDTPRVGPRTRAASLPERLVEVRDDLFRRLEPHGEPEQPLAGERAEPGRLVALQPEGRPQEILRRQVVEGCGACRAPRRATSRRRSASPRKIRAAVRHEREQAEVLRSTGARAPPGGRGPG